MQNQGKRLGGFGILLHLILLQAGCGDGDRPPLAAVNGSVNLDGQPLSNARVTFFPVDGRRASTGLTDNAGDFELVYLRDIRGAVVGEHVVHIQRLPLAEEAAPPKLLPKEYNDNSTLTALVESDHNSIDFSLRSD